MKKIIYIIFFLIISGANAQLKTVVGKTDYPFWINIPKNYTEKDSIPLLFFLHGRSLSGTDLNRVKRYGVINAIERGKNIPVIVVAPQLASGPWKADKLLEILKYIEKNYNINSKRVYVCGMSLGGYGTLEFAGKYPDKIASAVAICGGGVLSDACNLSKVPLWIIHGSNDKAVPLSESEKIFDAIKKCNKEAPAKLTIVQGGTHGSVEQFFHESEMYDWMFEKIKE